MQNDRSVLKSTDHILSYEPIQLNWIRGVAKRLFDILVSSLTLLLLSPFFGLIAYAIKRDTPGPAFYRGPRMGKNGKLFKILKFRTMHECPESYNGPSITADGDPRITQIGRWLRNTKLNELPQLWNVLKGEMSMVGPRPEDVEIASSWPDPIKKTLLSVRPGISSPASVLYRNEEKMLRNENLMDKYLNQIVPDKIRLDQLYVRNHSLLGDLDVLFLTAIALIPNLARERLPEPLLFSGPLSRIVNLYLSWFAIDSITALLAIGFTGTLWRISAPLHLGVPTAFGLAVGFALTFSMVNTALGLGRIAWQQANSALALDLLFSSALATIIFFGINHLFSIQMPPALFFNASLLSYFGFVAVRYRERLITGIATRWLHYRGSQAKFGERILVVGAGGCGQLAVWFMQKTDLIGAYTIFGMVDDDARKQGQIVEGYRVVGQAKDIPALVKEHDIALILFAITRIEKDEQQQILAYCRQTNARLVIFPEIMNIFRNHINDSVDNIMYKYGFE